MNVLYFLAAIALFRFTAYQVQRYSYKNAEYEGTVTSKYLDSNRKHEPTVDLRKANGDYLFHIELRNYDIFPAISEGDILIKKKGALKCALVHDHDTSFFYPRL